MVLPLEAGCTLLKAEGKSSFPPDAGCAVCLHTRKSRVKFKFLMLNTLGNTWWQMPV
jgi:hypothetical protein